MQDEVLYNCRLLLFEDHTLAAQPRHEVAVCVGRHEQVDHDIVGPSARFTGVHRFEGPMGTTAMVPNCGGNLPEGMVCIIWWCCFVLCNPFAMGDCDMLLSLLLLLLLLCGPMHKKRFRSMMKGMMVRCVHFVARRNHLFLSAMLVIYIIAVIV